MRRTTELEKALAALVPGRECEWAENVKGALVNVEHALSAHGARMQSSKGPADTIHEVAHEIMPTIDRRLANLSHEEADLFNNTRWLQSLLETISRPTTSATHPGIDDIRQSGRELVDALRQRKHAEIKIVLDNVNTDIGVGD